MYLFDLKQSSTKAKYLGSKIFKGKLVFGKYITPESGNTGIFLGSVFFILKSNFDK
jgi:hypothetical protein|tara:strand:- start:6463 stop:6630 length:168 start_codon:yes stop_codon:yes gene_type:complete